ncbi:MAG: NmrA/HSCARG family protein [Chloroflexota bacterium]
MDKKTIVVCGSTGNQGGAVVQSLLNSQSWQIIGLSRYPSGDRSQALKQKGVEVRKADLDDKSSLIPAFENAYGVFGVTQPWSPDYKKCNPQAEIKQGHNIIDACLQTGVKHLVLSTVGSIGTEKTGVSHVDSKLMIEEYARARRVSYTFLKPLQFMDNIGLPFFPIKQGSVRGFVDGDAKVPYIVCKDIGIFAALAFGHPDEYIGTELNVIGDFVSGEELCRILAKLRNGEHFKYKTVPRLVMRIFAKEFYRMRIGFEKWGRPPYPKELLDAMTNCKRLHPEIMSVERYLKSKEYDVKSL